MFYERFDDEIHHPLSTINDIKKIKNPEDVKNLYLYRCGLESLDKDIFVRFANLEYLNLRCNELESLDKDIFKQLTNLKRLYISSNKLESLDKEIFKDLTNLKELYLGYNRLGSLDKEIFKNLTNLKSLDFSNNKLESLDKDIFRQLTNLKYLSLKSNKLTSLPSSILNCTRLVGFYYYNNDVNYIPPNIQRFLNRITQQMDKMQVYNDGQNVHNHQIQESIKDSLQNILEIPKKINKDGLIQDLINNRVSDKSLGLILGYCEDKSVHTVLNITFEEALLHILSYIDTNLKKDKKEIYNILNQEMQDSECKCFTGRISRLINCLNGFTDLVEVKIPDNMAISNVILVTKNNYEGDNLDELKNIIKKELEEREYEESKIKEYLEHVEL